MKLDCLRAITLLLASTMISSFSIVPAASMRPHQQHQHQQHQHQQITMSNAQQSNRPAYWKAAAGVLVSLTMITGPAFAAYAADAAASSVTAANAVVPTEPEDTDNQLVQMAFRDFDQRRFDASDKEFSMSIAKWKDLHRPRDEIVSLLKARANVRLDSKQFDKAIIDYNECIELMKVDGEDVNGRSTYPEYPDTFVGRALAKEGLADWAGAVVDYDKAAVLWGGEEASSTRSTSISDNSADSTMKLQKRFEGVNPYVLTFRGNALARLDKLDKALIDYKVASDTFISLKDIARFSDARANYALVLYQLAASDKTPARVEKELEAVKEMKSIIRKNPGYADMHVAVAADDWYRGNYIEAMKEWRFTCESIDVGCAAYRDPVWVSTIRRWPDSLSRRLSSFLNRELPEGIRGKEGERLAPATPLIPRSAKAVL